jgi:hypothetical protein
MSSRAAVGALLVVAVAILVGCGGAARKSAAPITTRPPPTTTATPPPPPPTSSPQGPGALQAEAASVATGDIPDSQVFLLFDNAAGGYSIKYPEGWAQNGSGRLVTFSDKNNIVRIVVRPGSASVGSVGRELRTLKGARISRQPRALPVSGAPAVKVVYTTESAPNAVTGKRVTLTVDRYYLGHAGQEAIVDLGTPIGVDNVDAYRLMIESLRWR